MTDLKASADQKIAALDQKIESLKKKKEQISNKHLEQISKIIAKCDSNQLNLEMIAGIMLEAKERLAADRHLKESWGCVGEQFLARFKRPPSPSSSQGKTIPAKNSEIRSTRQEASPPTREDALQAGVD